MAEDINNIEVAEASDPKTPYVKGLYANLEHAYGSENLPDEQTFTKKILTDRQYRNGVRLNLIEAYGSNNVPDEDEFEKKIVPTIAGMRTYADQPKQIQKNPQKITDFLPKGLAEQKQRGDISGLPGVPKQPDNSDNSIELQQQAIKQNHDKALENTVKKRLQAKGIPNTEQNIKKESADVANLVQNGNLSIEHDKDGNPVYGRVPSWYENAINVFKNAVTQTQDNIEQVSAGNDYSKLANIIEKQINDDQNRQSENGIPLAEPSWIGKVAGLVAGLGTMPAAVFTDVSSKVKKIYQERKQELIDQGVPEDQARYQAAGEAANNAVAQAAPNTILNYSLLRGAPAAISPAGKSFAQALDHVLAKSTGFAAKGAGAEAATIGVEAAQGYKPHDIINRIADAAGNWFLMTAAMETLPQLASKALNLPKFAISTAKEYLTSPEMKPLVDEALQSMPNSTEVKQSLSNYENARKSVDGLVPDEHISSYAGVLERQNNLKQQILDLEARKDTTPEVLHGKINDQIKVLEDQIEATNKQLEEFTKSNNPLSKEYDDATGQSVEPTKETPEKTNVSQETVPLRNTEIGPNEVSEPVELSTEITNKTGNAPEPGVEAINKSVTEPTTQQNGAVEPPTPKGESIVTASGLNEQERQALIEKRKRETKVSDKALQANDLLEQIDKYNDMAKGRLGKSTPDGLKMLNEINIKARELGYKFDQASGKLKNGRMAIKPNLAAEGNRSIDEKGVTLRDRPVETQKAFDDAVDAGAFIDLPTLKGDKKMSANEIDGAIEDIHNGIPSVRANRYLDAFEESLKKDQFPVRDAYGQEQGLPFTDFIGAKKETVGQPLEKNELNSWLEDQSKLTPEHDQIVSDNIDNLIQEHDAGTEKGNTEKVSEPTARSARQSSEKTEPDNANIPSKNDQAEPAPAEPSNAKPAIGAPARKLAIKIREGKISKLGGFKSSTGFDAVWDGSLEVVATALEKGADIADAIEQGLKYIRNTDWYKNLTEKQDFEDKYKEHIESEQQRETGIKNEVTKQERAERGLSEVEVLTRRDFGEVYDKAKRYAEENPQYPLSLAQSLAEKPRAITPEESATLIYSRMKLQNEHNEIESKLATSLKDGNDAATTELLTRRVYLENNLQINDEAARRTGYEQGLGLAIRRMMIKEDYSMSRLITRAKVAMGGAEVPEELRAKLEILSKELQEANDKAIQYEEAIKKKDQELKFAKSKAEAQAEIQRNVRVNKRTITKEVLQVERKALIDELKIIAKEQRNKLSSNPIPLEMIPVLAKLTKNLVQDGIVTLEGVVDHIYDNVKDIVEGVTKRDVRDAITGYGKTTQLSKDEVNVQLREIKRQGRLVSAYEDAAGLNGEPHRPERSGFQRDEPSDKVRELEKQVKKALKDNGIEIERKESDPEKAWKSALEAYKTRLTNREVDLQEKIDKGDFTKEKRKPLVLDAEAMELQGSVNKLKRSIDLEIRKKELANRDKFTKGLDWFSQWRRAMLLTSVKTLGKLQSAAMQRTLLTPIEEIEGAVLSKIPGISKISAKAPREGSGWNATAEAKAISQWWDKATYQDIRDIIKSGKGKLDLLFGKRDELPPTALDFFGQLHQALKQAPKRGEFFRSFEKRTEFAIKQGVDVSDPVAQAAIASRAYVDANRAIFMQDNKVTSGYRMLIHYLEAPGKNDKTSVGGKVGATILKVLLPIVKVPTNYVAETTSYAAGGLKALVALRNGIKDLTPDQADYVMRNLKKQGLGVAILALGYYNAKNIGGYYQDHEKRDKKDVKAGGLKLFREDVPRWMLHTPLLEMLQIGATLRRVEDAYHKKGKEGGVAAGIFAAGMGLAKEVPFIDQPKQLSEASANADKASKWAASLVKSMIVPPDLANVAKSTDPAYQNDIKRKPQSIMDIFKMDIPGLREQVKTEIELVMEKRRHPKRKTAEEKQESAEQKREREQLYREMAKKTGVRYIPPRR